MKPKYKNFNFFTTMSLFIDKNPFMNYSALLFCGTTTQKRHTVFLVTVELMTNVESVQKLQEQQVKTTANPRQQQIRSTNNTTKISIKKIAHDMEADLGASVSIVVSIGQIAFSDMNLP